jgi:RNA polymerase sigma factor for flagellar operon FliA
LDPAVETMIRDHMGLAQSLAQQVWRGAPHALDLDELRAIAYLGLVSAVRRWKPYCAERQFSPEAVQFLKTFIVRRVHGALIDALRASDWATRNLRTRAKALQAAGQQSGASYTELADRSGMSVSDVRNTIRGMARRPVSLEGQDPQLIDPETDVESSVVVDLLLEEVVATVRALSTQHKLVMTLHYFEGNQLQHVAQLMGITESLASQLHAEAVLAVHDVLMTAVGGIAA